MPNPNQNQDDSLPDTVARVHFVISHTNHTPSAVKEHSRHDYKYDEDMSLLSVDIFEGEQGGSGEYFVRTDEAIYSVRQIQVGNTTYHLNEKQLVFRMEYGSRRIEMEYDSLGRKVTERVLHNGGLESEHHFTWNEGLMLKDSAYLPHGHYPTAITRYRFSETENPQINKGGLQLFGESNEREPSRKTTTYYDEFGVWKYTTYNKYSYREYKDSIIREDIFWNSTYVDSLSVYQTDTYVFRSL